MNINSIAVLQEKIKESPTNINLVEQLASYYGRQKRWDEASQCYANYLKYKPDDPVSHFNYAYNLRFSGQYSLAIEQYRKALALNISEPEEVYVNIAVIYSDYLDKEEQSIIELKQALLINKRYIPALYNLANLYEDLGDKNKAKNLFKKILAINPKYYDALARLAQIETFSDKENEIIIQLIKANNDSDIDLTTNININFALGKALDDCREYSQAILYYKRANKLSQKNTQPYNPDTLDKLVENIIKVFSDDGLKQLPINNDIQPVFICGMFRSGSTLVEQILAAHSKISAGGEREFFIRLVENELAPYPEAVINLQIEQLFQIAKNYLNDLYQAFPHEDIITDKRPENFLFVGLIKCLFPNAKFIYTQRNILDNCLSVYFLRLGNRMNYSLSLTSTKHYYKLQAKLMDFWQEKYKESIHVVNYDALVNEPETEIRNLTQFLDLKWEPTCLNFHNVKNRVKTASVWQVRRPLYKTSSGRWKNYENYLAELIEK